MSTEKTPPATTSSIISTLTVFFALYLTTLFSLDNWAAARDSPYRGASTAENNFLFRPASRAPAPDSYQGGMHGRGNAGSGSSGSGSRGARLPQTLDSRPPLKLGATAKCGACMT